MRIRVLAASAFCLFLPICASFADPIGINQLVVFGDSLSDNGNAAAALASAGKTLGNYAPNALTDGPNTTPANPGPYSGLWIDQFASKFGLAPPTPFVVNTSSGLTINPAGTNFAVASALAGSNPNFNPTNFLNPANPQVPGTTDQVGLYSSFTGGKASSSALYVLWAGANNIDSALSSLSLATLDSTAKAAADDIAGQKGNIATLAAEGAKNFLLFNLPPLGEIPAIQQNPVIKLLGTTLGNQAASDFNAELSADAASLEKTLGINIVQVDIDALFNQIAADPSKYGFNDITHAGWCGQDGVGAACASNNPNQFLFWDELHPTTAADYWIANTVMNDVSGIFTASGSTPSSVPEPGPFALVGIGVAGIVWLKRKLT